MSMADVVAVPRSEPAGMMHEHAAYSVLDPTCAAAIHDARWYASAASAQQGNG